MKFIISMVLVLPFVAHGQNNELQERVRRYENLAEKIRTRQYPGGRDEQPIQVQKDLFKPAKGTTGAQLESATAVEESPSTTE